MSYPNSNDTFVLDTDASNDGIGSVLSQVQNGEEKVIAYGSKPKTQRRYCTTYRELLAIVMFVKQFKHYLWARKFLFRADHSSLKWLRNFKEPEGIIARWNSVLDTYDFDIQHRKGSLHVNADAMFRKPRRRCNQENCKYTDIRVHVVRSTNSGQKRNGVTTNWFDQWSDDHVPKLQLDDPSLKAMIEIIQNEDDTLDPVSYGI